MLLFLGAEDDIWNYYNNTGFVQEQLAKKLGALVVYSEHRYFG